MNLNWEDVGAIGGLLTAGFGLVSYMVNSQVGTLSKRLDKMDLVLEKLTDYTGKIAVLDERFLAQGKRQDEVDVRLNDMSRRIGDVLVSRTQRGRE